MPSQLSDLTVSQQRGFSFKPSLLHISSSHAVDTVFPPAWIPHRSFPKSHGTGSKKKGGSAVPAPLQLTLTPAPGWSRCFGRRPQSSPPGSEREWLSLAATGLGQDVLWKSRSATSSLRQPSRGGANFTSFSTLLMLTRMDANNSDAVPGGSALGAGGHWQNSPHSPHKASLSLPFHPLRWTQSHGIGAAPQPVRGGWPRFRVSMCC